MDRNNPNYLPNVIFEILKMITGKTAYLKFFEQHGFTADDIRSAMSLVGGEMVCIGYANEHIPCKGQIMRRPLKTPGASVVTCEAHKPCKQCGVHNHTYHMRGDYCWFCAERYGE
jgi:hypothetical protein